MLIGMRLTKIIPVTLGIVMILLSCEDYQDEEYKISTMDKYACDLLTVDTTIIEKSIDAWFFTDTTQILAGFSDSLQALIDSASVVRLTEDTLWSVEMEDVVAFMAFHVSEETGSVILFLDEAVELDLFTETGTFIAPESISIPFETVADCGTIKGRFSYQLGVGYYMIRLSSEAYSDFNAVILSEDS